MPWDRLSFASTNGSSVVEHNATHRLRVGILCNGTTFQRWQAEAIRAVLAVPGVVPVVLVVKAEDDTNGSGRQRSLPHWRTALYRRYRAKYMKVSSMDLVDLSYELEGIPIVRARVDLQGISEHFTADGLQAIAAHAPDVLLRFGFNILRGGILQLPRYGVWSFHHGDEQKYRGGPPGLWEIMQGDPVTGAILQRLTEKLDGGIVLRKGWFKTIDHSLRETVDTVLRATAIWPAQVCRDILAGRHEVVDGAASTTTAPIHRYPGNLTFLHFLWKQALNKARFHRDELRRHEEWNIGVLYQPIEALLAERPSLNVRWLPSPASGTFRADPFGYRTGDGRLNVLYEKYNYDHGRGEIARLRPRRDNFLKRSRTVLSNGSHLSYPFLLDVHGVRYVVPECAASGRVDAYITNEDGSELVFDRTVLDEPLYDPTIVEHGGRWWLFGTKAPLTNVELHVYHATHPLGPYTPHAQNPVKLDVRSARPGGTPFRHEGQLYRPAQDSSLTYGHRIAINRIVELSPDRFHEETVRVVGPIKGAYSAGLHTLSAVGDVTLVDGKRWTYNAAQQRRAMKKKVARVTAGDRDMEDEDDDE